MRSEYATVNVLAAMATGTLLVQEREVTPPISIAVTFSLACCQMDICAALAILAPLRWSLRLFWIAVPLAYWCWVHGEFHVGFKHWLAIFAPIVFLTLLGAVFARFALALRFTRADRMGATEGGGAALADSQYSLRSLILSTTLAAVGCAILRIAGGAWQSMADDVAVYEAGAVFTDVTLLYVWSSIHARVLLKSVLLVVVAIVAFSLRSFDNTPPQSFNVLVSLLHVGFSAGTLHVMKRAGVVLVKCGRKPQYPRVQETGTTSTLPN